MTDAAVRVERVDDRIVVESTYRDVEVVKQLPGAQWNKDGKFWHAPLSWATCVTLRGLFGDRLAIGADLEAWAWDVAHANANALAWRDSTDGPGNPQLRPYQRVAVGFLYCAGRALLADDMGTGKTVVVASLLRLLTGDDPFAVEVGLTDRQPFPALVVAPASTLRQWERELGRWCPTARVAIVRGAARKRRDALELVGAGEVDVAVMSWDNLRNHSRLAPYGSTRLRRCDECDPEHVDPDKPRKRSSCHWCTKELNAIDWRTVVADEAHRMKDGSSQRTRAAWAIAHGVGTDNAGASFRFALTGTPIVNNVADFWSIGHFLDEREYPAKTKFVDRYALQSWNAFGGLEIIGIRPDTRAELDAFLNPRFLRRPLAAVLPQLPTDPTRVDRVVDLPAKQRARYTEIAEEMLLRLDDGDQVVLANPLVQVGRLNQAASAYLDEEECDRCGGMGYAPAHVDREELSDAIACTGCGGEGRRLRMTTPSAKVDDLVELLTELPDDERVVVFTQHKQLADLVVARLERENGKGELAGHATAALYAGGVPDIARETALAAFQSGEVRVFVATIGAGGEGLDGLQVARIAVFLERSYSRVQNAQAEGRLIRSGQQSHVTIVDVRAAETIEDDKDAILAEKEGRFQELVRDADALRRLLQIRP